jgi:DNA ligase-1
MTTKPHLCCDLDLDKISETEEVMVFPKLDGVRGLHITGSMTGRSLKPHGNMYVTEKYSQVRCTGFDGEFTFGDIRGDSLCRDTTSVMSTIQGEPKVFWNLFDYLREDLLDKPYIDRYNELLSFQSIHQSWFDLENIRVIPYKLLKGRAAIVAYYDKCLDDGYEGVVIRSKYGLHKSGRATAKEGNYLRMKPQSDKEAIVVRLVEAMENLNEAKVNALGRTERSSHQENKVGKGMVGMLVCTDCTTGKEIDVGAGKMTHEERAHYWENPDEMVGQMVKYRSMDAGVKDKPRFARYICKRSTSDVSE